MTMKPKSNEETWAWQKLPPSVIFGAMDLIPEDIDDEHATKRRNLTQLVELMELTTAPRASIEAGQQRPVSVGWARRFLTALSALVTGLKTGFFHDELQTWAPDLLARYERALPIALPNLRAARAVLYCALENLAGAQAGETVEARLARSIRVAKTEAPIDLGSFAEYADESAE